MISWLMMLVKSSVKPVVVQIALTTCSQFVGDTHHCHDANKYTCKEQQPVGSVEVVGHRRKRRIEPAAIILGLLVLLPTIYIGSCSYRSYANGYAFDALHAGDSEAMVLDAMGAPSAREVQAGKLQVPFSSGCHAPCVTRLWYLNRMSLTGESWSFDIGKDRQIISKVAWHSP